MIITDGINSRDDGQMSNYGRLNIIPGYGISMKQLEERVAESCHINGRIGLEMLNYWGVASLAIESLITSCTSFDRSLAIINNSSRGAFVKRIASINKIHYFEYLSEEKQIPCVESVERFLMNHTSIAYLLLPVINLKGAESELMALSEMLNDLGIGLLVDYYGKLADLSLDLLKYQVLCVSITPSDFDPGIPASSVLVAQRRFLVNCEGNAKTYSLDLYATWQKKLWANKNMVV